jgi:hypothetical protein
MQWDELNMRTIWLMIGLCLLSLFTCGSGHIPSDAKTIELDQSVVDYAPGAYYTVEVPTPGTLAVTLEELPADMKTRIIIMNEDEDWLADTITDTPGQLVTVEANAAAPGLYCIEVMDLEGKTHETPYAFRVTLGKRLFGPY